MHPNNQFSLNNILLRMHPLQRVLCSVLITLIVYFFIRNNLSLIKILLLWNVFSLSYLIFSWVVLLNRTIPEIKKLAKKDDGSAIFVFILIIVSSSASLVTVLLLMLTQKHETSTDSLYLPVAIAGIILSWMMVHSLYAFHYAHMYYDDDEDNTGKDANGLEFPGDAKPGYIDFAYFSFVIGCTFQVSDVEISSPKIRRVVLFHGLLSFALNTFVVALTINLVADLLKS